MIQKKEEAQEAQKLSVLLCLSMAKTKWWLLGLHHHVSTT
jgi:hypothetical protein